MTGTRPWRSCRGPMPRADGTFHNSHDMADAVPEALITNLWSSGYDASHRGGKLAPWALFAPKGQTFKPDPTEKISTLMYRQGAVHVFAVFADAAAWAEKHLGITGWKRDRWGGYHPSLTAHDIPCEARVHQSGRAAKGSVCDKKVKPGETMCGVRLAGARRRAEADQKYQEQKEGWARDDRLSKDCREAAAKLDIPVGKGHHVSMHAEDFLALC